MSKNPIETVGKILDSAETVVSMAERLDKLIDRTATVVELRRRAAVCRRKASNSKRKAVRLFWMWRARRHDARADRLERKA